MSDTIGITADALLKTDIPSLASERMRRLPPYLFGTINRVKDQLRRKGVDIIDLGMGNPNDPTPQVIVDKLIEAAASEPDTAKRLGLFREAEDLLINGELPIMPIYFYSNLSLRTPSVKGFYGNPRDLHPCKYIFLVPEEQ